MKPQKHGNWRKEKKLNRERKGLNLLHSGINIEIYKEINLEITVKQVYHLKMEIIVHVG